MKIAKAILVAVSLSLSTAGCAAEWEPLFNNQNLDEWEQKGGNATYTVENGVITGTTAPGQKQNAFLITKKTYQDFELEFEFKVHPELNSGVQIRSESKPDYKDGRVHGYQVEIDPSPRSFTGGIYDEGRRAVFLADLKDKPEARAAFKQNEWNTLYVSARGNHIITKINGVEAVNFRDDMTSSGFIGLQVHSTKSMEPMTVQWRNLRIKDWVWIKETAWETDRPFGNYVSKEPALVAQVTAHGHETYRAVVLRDLESRQEPLARLEGKKSDAGIILSGGGWSATLNGNTLTGKQGDGTEFTATRTEIPSPTLGKKMPEGAIALVADGMTKLDWTHPDGKPARWSLKDGVMEVRPGTGNVVSEEKGSDFRMHLEFRTSFMPNASGQDRANSGVYVQGAYEIQILDSFALEGKDNECGGIYKVGAPRLNMAAPPLQWQTYDIEFRSAKWDNGEKTKNASITVSHNGTVIHENADLPTLTGGALYKEEPQGDTPVVLLQDHSDLIQFRNIWFEPID